MGPRFRPAPLLRLLAPYRGLGASLWSMFFATMINRSGDFVAPFLSLYLSRSLGFDAARTGGMVALVFGASALGAFCSGRIADVLGRKAALLACEGAAAAFHLAMSFALGREWAVWLLAAASFFRGGVRPLIGAVLTDLSRPERRKEVFGLQYWSINVGMALGALAAGFLFHPAPPWVLPGGALCTLLSVALIGAGVRMPAGPAAAATSLERHDRRGALRAFAARPILLAFAALTLVSATTYSQVGFGLPLSVSAAFGAKGPGMLGMQTSFNALVVIVLGIPVARALRALSPLACMALSGVFFVAGFGLLAWPLAAAGFFLSTFIWTVGEIVASVNMGVFLARHSPVNWRGSFQSFNGAFSQGGWSLGPLLSGLLLRPAGLAALWAATAGACALWAAGALLLDRWDRRLVAVSQAT